MSHQLRDATPRLESPVVMQKVLDHVNSIVTPQSHNVGSSAAARCADPRAASAQGNDALAARPRCHMTVRCNCLLCGVDS